MMWCEPCVEAMPIKLGRSEKMANMLHRKRSLYIRLGNLDVQRPPYKSTTFRELLLIAIINDLPTEEFEDLVDATKDADIMCHHKGLDAGNDESSM